MTARFLVIIGFVFIAVDAMAADSKGLFMVKGGGSASCTQFLNAQAKGNNEYISLAGWLDGYLTHLNQSQDNTFDMAPWQDTHLLLAAIGSWCKKNPDKTFHQAAFQITASLHPTRLPEKSELITAQHKGQSVVLYREILIRVQKKLSARGFLDAEATGNFDQATIKALEGFQKDKNIPVTGLPDQVTLANLL